MNKATKEELICEIQSEIQELISAVRGGLQEIRQGVVSDLSDAIALGSFSEIKLIHLLNQQPSVIREIMGTGDEEWDTAFLPTETSNGLLRYCG